MSLLWAMRFGLLAALFAIVGIAWQMLGGVLVAVLAVGSMR